MSDRGACRLQFVAGQGLAFARGGQYFSCRHGQGGREGKDVFGYVRRWVSMWACGRMGATKSPDVHFDRSTSLKSCCDGLQDRMDLEGTNRGIRPHQFMRHEDGSPVLQCHPCV
jgi:hypothetical protein